MRHIPVTTLMRLHKREEKPMFTRCYGYKAPTKGIRKLDCPGPETLLIVLDIDPKTGAYVDLHWTVGTPLRWIAGSIRTGYGGNWSQGLFSTLQRVWKKQYGRSISLRTVKKQIAEFLEESK